MKKIPMRSCLITHEKLPKKDLIRIVRTPLGEVLVDKNGKLNGKGAYLKKDIKVILKAKQSKIIDKVFEMEIDNQIYDELMKECDINE